MATFKGPIRFDGSLGDLRSYWDSDIKEQILSQKRGRNAKTYNNLRVKELNREFKALNIWAKILRIGTDDLAYLKKGRQNGKLVKIAKRIQKMDWFGVQGTRRIESSKFNAPLVGFCMNNAHPFREACDVNPVISITDDRSEVTLRLNNFVSHLKFKWTESISYYRILLSIFEMPDVEWSDDTKKYLPAYEHSTLGKKTVAGDWIAVASNPIDFQISAAFDQNSLPREKTMVVVSMGVEFASILQIDSPYFVKDNGTMEIVACL